MAELDAEIADAIAAHDFCQDPRRRAEVSRELGDRPGLLRRDGLKTRWRIAGLTAQTMKSVHERAGHAAALGHRAGSDAAQYEEFERLSENYAVLGPPVPFDKRHEDQLSRLYGSRKEQAAVLAALTLRIWDVVRETAWAGAPALPSPIENSALIADWSKSPNTMIRSRRALLEPAAAGHRLTLEPREGAAATLRITPAG